MDSTMWHWHEANKNIDDIYLDINLVRMRLRRPRPSKTEIPAKRWSSGLWINMWASYFIIIVNVLDILSFRFSLFLYFLFFIDIHWRSLSHDAHFHSSLDNKYSTIYICIWKFAFVYFSSHDKDVDIYVNHIFSLSRIRYISESIYHLNETYNI